MSEEKANKNTPWGRFNGGGGAYNAATSTGVFIRSTETRGLTIAGCIQVSKTEHATRYLRKMHSPKLVCHAGYPASLCCITLCIHVGSRRLVILSIGDRR